MIERTKLAQNLQVIILYKLHFLKTFRTYMIEKNELYIFGTYI